MRNDGNVVCPCAETPRKPQRRKKASFRFLLVIRYDLINRRMIGEHRRTGRSRHDVDEHFRQRVFQPLDHRQCENDIAREGGLEYENALHYGCSSAARCCS